MASGWSYKWSSYSEYLNKKAWWCNLALICSQNWLSDTCIPDACSIVPDQVGVIHVTNSQTEETDPRSWIYTTLEVQALSRCEALTYPPLLGCMGLNLGFHTCVWLIEIHYLQSSSLWSSKSHMVSRIILGWSLKLSSSQGQELF